MKCDEIGTWLTVGRSASLYLSSFSFSFSFFFLFLFIAISLQLASMSFASSCILLMAQHILPGTHSHSPGDRAHTDVHISTLPGFATHGICSTYVPTYVPGIQEQLDAAPPCCRGLPMVTCKWGSPIILIRYSHRTYVLRPDVQYDE